jgi:aryl-alcohol dehydrogenase-like predicted oxidoreductase/adenylate kinase family enzyme
MPWLDPAELRIGLGCMRLPDDERLAFATVAAAADAGVSVFDTAHAYAPEGAGPGHNERMLARALRSTEAANRARIITKGGMTRTTGRWIPDGRGKTIAAHCEASLEALDGLPIDLYLLHAPDPLTPWRTSVRSLARLVEGGLVERVGVANVNRTQLDQALELAPVAAVQVALSPFDERALRGGIVSRCAELGLVVIAHSPLGGPARADRLARRSDIARIASAHDATAAEVTLAWLLALSPVIVAIPGARRPVTARSAAKAASLDLPDRDRDSLSAAFGRPDAPSGRRPAVRPGAESRGEIVMIMGIPGAGKTRLAFGYAERGYVRLNRDERGGSLRRLAAELDEELESRVSHAVLDNTYLTRASRSYVIDAAVRHGLPLRCVWLDTPLAQAQVNLVLRLIGRFGRLPTPEQIREASRKEPWLMLPVSQMRARRELEPPSSDEGFAVVERMDFTRQPVTEGRAGVFIGAAALDRPRITPALCNLDPAAPHLVFDWLPEDDAAALEPAAAEIGRRTSGPVEVAACPHPGGPPRCWCRPPLPGLALAFAARHGVDPAHSILIGCSPAHRTLAATLGARYIAV